ITPGIKEIPDDYIEYVGRNYLFYLPELDEIEQRLAGEYCLEIIIKIYPEWLKIRHSQLNHQHKVISQLS
ncbi:MAG: helix-turn-helix transcriptional regulator, partial [Nostoc sp.]